MVPLWKSHVWSQTDVYVMLPVAEDVHKKASEVQESGLTPLTSSVRGLTMLASSTAKVQVSTAEREGWSEP